MHWTVQDKDPRSRRILPMKLIELFVHVLYYA